VNTHISTQKAKSLALFTSVATVLALSAMVATPWLAAPVYADPGNDDKKKECKDKVPKKEVCKPDKKKFKKFKFFIDNDSVTLENVKIEIDNGFDQVNKAVAVAKKGNAAAVVVAPVSINNAVVIQICVEDCHQETVVAQDNTNVIEVNIAQDGSVNF
jgi:hypothetical protein